MRRAIALHLDVRILGVCFHDMLFQGVDLEAACDEFFSPFFSYPSAEMHDQGGGIVKFVWHSNEQKLSWWIDTKQGYTPIRIVRQFRRPESNEDWQEPFQTHQVGWNRVVGVWVPTSYDLFYRKELPSNPPLQPTDYKYAPVYESRAYKYTFDWESVNQPVAVRYFAYEDFDVPDDTKVVDVRTGERIYLETVGSSNRIRLEAPNSWFSLWGLLMLSTALIIIALLAVWFWRRRTAM